MTNIVSSEKVLPPPSHEIEALRQTIAIVVLHSNEKRDILKQHLSKFCRDKQSRAIHSATSRNRKRATKSSQIFDPRTPPREPSRDYEALPTYDPRSKNKTLNKPLILLIGLLCINGRKKLDLM